MQPIRKILVPTDFSQESIAALTFAALFARAFKAEITLLHIMESYEHNTVLDNLGVSMTDVLREGIEKKLDELISEHTLLQEVNLTTRIEQGKVHRVVHDIVEDDAFDLVVMGTHGASGIRDFEKFVLGSNAYRIVNTSKVPVITIRNPERSKRIERIVLPLDITKQTTQKVDFAIELAKTFHANIQIVALTEFLDDFNPNIDRLPKELMAVEEKVQAAGIDCTAVYIKYKDVAKGVVEFTDNVRGDLIVIMTRQENIIEEWLIGSHARKIIGQSQVPVLSVRPQ